MFLRLMALSKGRVMLSRALRLLFPPPEVERMARRGVPMQAPPVKLLWVLLRHLRFLFHTGAGLGPGPAGELRQAAVAPTTSVVQGVWGWGQNQQFEPHQAAVSVAVALRRPG